MGYIYNFTYNSINYNISYDDEYKVATTTNGLECLSQTANSLPGGAVPTRALGLSFEHQFDGWGRKFMYQVSINLCGNRTSTATYCTPASFCIVPPPLENCASTNYNNNNGNLSISKIDVNGNAVSNTTISDGAYVLLSYGANGSGAYTMSGSQKSISNNSNEIENSNGDKCLYYGQL